MGQFTVFRQPSLFSKIGWYVLMIGLGFSYTLSRRTEETSNAYEVAGCTVWKMQCRKKFNGKEVSGLVAGLRDHMSKE